MVTQIRAGVLTVVTLLATAACSATTASHTATSTTIGPSSTTVPSSTVPPTSGRCEPPAGGRCAGPAPVDMWLVGSLAVSADGRTISGRFQCGGQLTVKETPDQVTLTFVAGAVGAGAMSCALVPLSVVLGSPLGARTLIDGVTHQPLVHTSG